MKQEINYNKTFEQALAAMRKGRKIQHALWRKDIHLQMIAGKIFHNTDFDTDTLTYELIESNEWGIIPTSEDYAKLNNAKIELQILMMTLAKEESLRDDLERLCMNLEYTNEKLTDRHMDYARHNVIAMGIKVRDAKLRLRGREEAL